MSAERFPPMPPKHRLDFYRVLGTLQGLYMLLYPNDTNAETERRAAAALARCKPTARRVPT